MDLEALKFCAKYPFTSYAKNTISELRFDFENISDDYIDFAYSNILALMTKQPMSIKDIDRSKENFLTKTLVSYPISNIIINLSKTPGLKMQYARLRAQQVMQFLLFDSDENLMKVANDLFKIDNGRISFQSYLNNLPFGDSWKLVYQELENGAIKVNEEMLISLISEKFFSSIMNTGVKDAKFPKLILFYANELKEKQIKAEFSQDFGKIDTKAFPPCMRKIISDLQTDLKVGHMSRFVLATFLVNIGMKDNDIVDVFRKQDNFKEELVRYHISNIKGEKGNMVKYSVPACPKMDSYNTCYRDETCRWKHPLSYYKYTKERIERKKK